MNKSLFLLIGSSAAISFRPISGTVPWHAAITEPSFLKPDHPVNYPVPDFGVDRDIIDATKNIKDAENVLGKKLAADFSQTKNPLNPRDYSVPDFGEDHDILAVKEDISNAEKKLGKTLHADFGFTDGVPRNYFVPDFGVDHNIAISLNNSKSWTPTKDKEGKWIVPENDVEFKL